MNFFSIRKIMKQEKHIKCIYSAFFWLQKCRFERLEVHQTCIYSKKINILMPKVHNTCIYTKKSKVLIVKSHQTCIYSKKKQKKSHLCQCVPHRVWDFWFFWSFWVYAGLVIFHYQNFWLFLSICRLCAFLASKCCFFWEYAGLVNLKSLKPAYTQKSQTFW